MGRGRPEKPESERRSLTHGLRLSPVEKEELEEKADRAGLSLNEYLRKRAFGKSIKTQIEGKAVDELNRIGVNLNQIAIAANRAQLEEIEKQARAAIRELRELIEQIEG